MEMARQIRRVNGKRFVLIAERELKELERRAAKANGKSDSSALPPLPPPDERGNRPAVEFAQASIARSIVQDRLALGLSQQELARLAGVRQETISRIESGKHSPTVRTVEKIDKALNRAMKRGREVAKRN